MNLLKKLYNPEIFQGNLKLNPYFEGWYHKHSKKDGTCTFSLIPGISLTENPHSFIQYIDGITGKTHYFKFPLSEFNYDSDSYKINIANNSFSSKGCSFNLRDANFTVSGNFTYSNTVQYPVKLFSPGIMGPFSFIPKMQCIHGIVSPNHNVSGTIKINSTDYIFHNDKGYIEKDRGFTFPTEWIWLQANNFENDNISIFFSTAEIPFKFFTFYGLICFLYLDGKFHKFTTYNKSKILNIIKDSDNNLSILLKKGKYRLQIGAAPNYESDLIAPDSDGMKRKMKESLNADISYKLFKKNTLLSSGTSSSGGFEIGGQFLENFNKSTS